LIRISAIGILPGLSHCDPKLFSAKCGARAIAGTIGGRCSAEMIDTGHKTAFQK
jgi:hypothetical protein